jgi:hypothetical protein
VLALYFLGLWLMTSNSDLAASLRSQASHAFGGGADSPASTRAPNGTFFSRYATHLRIAGIALVVLTLILLPDVGWGALAVGVMVALVYLALVDYLSTRQSG